MRKRVIFVFGSNEAGLHGAGSAYEALKFWGARPGIGEGLQGDSYAIPTKDKHINTLSLEKVRNNVDRFIRFAIAHSDWTFHIVKIGCGLAGFTEAEIKPLFKEAPANCELPKGWES